MISLRQALVDYLAMRRALGVELRRPGKALDGFVRFAQRCRAPFITAELALRWAKLPERATPATWAERLGIVRRFARFCSAMDPRTEVPPDGLLPHPFRRKPPFIYADADIERLLGATRQLASKRGLRPLTYETLFGLLTVTGMRISEALALDDADVDLTTGVVTIRKTKFGKSRLVPVHASTQHALRRYAGCRDRAVPRRATKAIFVTEHGTRLSQGAVRWIFARLVRDANLRAPAHHRRPRIHDLRHSFAVHALLRWYRRGLDAETRLPTLATYLGHAHVADTYWYLTAVPELMHMAVRRAERRAKRSSP